MTKTRTSSYGSTTGKPVRKRGRRHRREVPILAVIEEALGDESAPPLPVPEDLAAPEPVTPNVRVMGDQAAETSATKAEPDA